MSVPPTQVIVQATNTSVVEVITAGPQGPTGPMGNPGPNSSPTTVANLGPATSGLRSMVTDANAITFASVVAGGGANTVPVYADGMAWRIG